MGMWKNDLSPPPSPAPPAPSPHPPTPPSPSEAMGAGLFLLYWGSREGPCGAGFGVLHLPPDQNGLPSSGFPSLLLSDWKKEKKEYSENRNTNTVT